MRIASSRKPGLAAARLKSVNTSRDGLVHGRRMSTNTHGGTRSATLIIAALCLLGACAGAHAADATLVVDHLTASDGLPQGPVVATRWTRNRRASRTTATIALTRARWSMTASAP